MADMDNQNLPKRVQVGPGPLVEYYSDLSSGLLPPENMRIENLTFKATVNPSGEITSFTQAIQIISQYNFAIRRIVGWIQNPLSAGNAPALVGFNVFEQGRNMSIFKTPINFSSVTATSGAGNVAEFDGVYICIPGTQLEVQWFPDTVNWPILVGATRTFGIQIIGDYVVCRSR